MFIRNMQESDLPLVYATWLKGQRNGNSWFKSIDQDIYFSGYKKVVEGRIASSECKVSCLETDPDVVLGYSIYSPDHKVLHWVYVKKAWRKMGIAKSLLPSGIEQVTSLTRLGRLILKKRAKFNPFI